MNKTIKDITCPSIEHQEFRLDNQLLFEQTKDGYKQLLGILDIKKAKINFLVKLVSTKDNKSKELKRVTSNNIEDAIEYFNKIKG